MSRDAMRESFGVGRVNQNDNKIDSEQLLTLSPRSDPCVPLQTHPHSKRPRQEKTRLDSQSKNNKTGWK